MNVEQPPRRFQKTRWTLVVRSMGDGPRAEAALAQLCEIYWGPAYAFVRRSGVPADKSLDLTQAFFVKILEKGYFRDARPDRGRFRSYLLGCLRHFLSNERDAERALRRGGGHRHIRLDAEAGERLYQLEPADEMTPERIFERRWTMAVLDEAMARVARRYAESGRGALFAHLKGTITGDEDLSYRELASTLETTEGALRVAVHRLRKDYGAALRTTIAETVDRPEEVDDEVRYLLEVVGRPGPRSPRA